MIAAGNPVAFLGLDGGIEQAVAEFGRHDAVGLAVDDQKRCADGHDLACRIEPVLDQPAGRQVRVVLGRHVGHRGERRLQDERPHRPLQRRLHGHVDGHAGPQGFAVEDDAFGRNFLFFQEKIHGGAAVGIEAVLGRFPFVATVAAVTGQHDAEAGLHEITCLEPAVSDVSRVAVEDDDGRLPALGRPVPRAQPQAVRRGRGDHLHLGDQAGRRRRHRGVGEIEHAALQDEQRTHEGRIDAHRHNDEIDHALHAPSQVFSFPPADGMPVPISRLSASPVSNGLPPSGRPCRSPRRFRRRRLSWLGNRGTAGRPRRGTNGPG